MSPNQQRTTAVPRNTYGKNTVKRLPSGCCSRGLLQSGMNLLQTPLASNNLKPSNPRRSRTKWATLTIAPTRTPVPTACRWCQSVSERVPGVSKRQNFYCSALHLCLCNKIDFHHLAVLRSRSKECCRNNPGLFVPKQT